MALHWTPRIRHSQYRQSGIQIFIALSHLRNTKSNDCNCMDFSRVRSCVRYHSFASIAIFIHNMRLICLFHLNVLLWRLCTAAEDQFTYLFASHNRREASRASTTCLQSDVCSATWWIAYMNGTNGMRSFRIRVDEKMKQNFLFVFLLALNAKAQTNFHNNNFQIEWNFIFRTVRMFFLSLLLAWLLVGPVLRFPLGRIFLLSKDTHTILFKSHAFNHLFICFRSDVANINMKALCAVQCRCRIQTLMKLVLKNAKRSIYCFDYVYDC